jgi:hypothetical protein
MRCSRCGHVFVLGRDEEKGEERVKERPLLSPPGIVETAGQEPKRRGVLILFLAILLILILAAAGYYYWLNYLGAENRWLSIQKMEGQETLIRDGRVFLIRGVVLNRSTKPRKYIILRAKLFDDKKAPMGERFGLAGLQFSNQEIERMGKPDIEAKISKFRKLSDDTFVVPPRKGMPFSIVFAAPYSARPKEFSVEIAEAPRLDDKSSPKPDTL